MAKQHDGKVDYLKAAIGGTRHVADKQWTYDSPKYGSNQVGYGMKGQRDHGHYNPHTGYNRGFDGYEWNDGKGKGGSGSSDK